jgi:uncharacterized protein (DUF1800 family)
LSFDPTIAAIRFGCGLSPNAPPPASAAAMLGALAGPDRAATDWPIPTFSAARPSLGELRAAVQARKAARDSNDAAAIARAVEAYDAIRSDGRKLTDATFLATVARSVGAEDGFRERLTLFWADHFTVTARKAFQAHLVTPYVEEAIRPHLAGNFADMLKAVMTHPMMLIYLNQVDSVGPTSPAARGGRRGLNENLARELLELHTLGVGGPYTQDDVRQLAELLTGLDYGPDDGFFYDRRAAEPGAETVLGVTYSPEASLQTVMAFLDDLARNPATARHIAGKLAGHFVADLPDPDMVDAMSAQYVATGGDLMAVYAAMLDHPAAWVAEARKVKQPFGFVTSALRALGTPPAQIMALRGRDLRQTFRQPLENMGQAWQKAIGPNGWPEEADAWVTPQFMAQRINWALAAPKRLNDDLPDPRDFVTVALGPNPPEAVRFAAGAAEDRAIGVGAVIVSAAFQRR